MAWSKVTGASVTGGGTVNPSTTLNIGNLGAAVQANDRLIAVISGYVASDRSVVSIADSVNATGWVQLAHTYNSVNLNQCIWTCVSGAGTPADITITWGAGAQPESADVSVQAYRGVDATASPLDGDPLQAYGGTGVTLADSGTTPGTTSAANGLKIGAYSDAGYNLTLTAGTLDTNYTIDISNAPSGRTTAAIESADSGAAGSSARATVTMSGTTARWIMTVLVLKATSTGQFARPIVVYYARLRG